MAENSSRKFKFISPGVFIDEIDNSELPAEPGTIGPLVIGRSRKGPANKPIRIVSFSDFVETFGDPVPGKANSDAWREGVLSAPAYATYAAQAWLRNSSPLTFLRVLGDESTSATAAGKAGWKVGTATSANETGGVYALVVWPSQSLNTVAQGAVAAQFYLESGRLLLSGNLANARAGKGAQGQNASSVYEITNLDSINLVVTSSAINEKVTVSLNPDSENFVRKALNTNPIITNSAITTAATRNFYQGGVYWLGESFSRSLTAAGTNSIGVLGASLGAGVLYGAILPMAVNGSVATQQNDFEGGATRGTTGWFISQDLSTNSAAYNARNMQKLFRLEAITAGEWAQRDIKVSISKIKAPEGDYEDYGSFSVLVRRIGDTDNNLQIIERFDNLNLNPASPNYLALRIGDKYEVYNQTTLQNEEFGSFNNQSNYIRVVMDKDVGEGSAESRFLPFGCFGPLKYRDVGVVSGSGGWSTNVTAPLSGARGGVRSMLDGNRVAAFGEGGHLDPKDSILFGPSVTASVGGTGATVTSTVVADYDTETFILTGSTGTVATFTFADASPPSTLDTINIGAPMANTIHNIRAQITASINLKQASVPSTMDITASAGAAGVIILDRTVGGTRGNGKPVTGSSTNTGGPITLASRLFTNGSDFSGSVVFPSVPLRQLSSWGSPKSLQTTYWGAWTGRTATDTFYNPQLTDTLRVRSFDVQSAGEAANPASTSHDVQGETIALKASDSLTIAWVFSLDDMMDSGAGAFAYTSGSRRAGTAISSKGSHSYKSVLSGGLDQFTSALFGGSDGYDITESEPFRNSKFSAATSENASYELFSLRKAINMISEPDYLQMNAVTVPGVWVPGVTDYLLEEVETRADSLALIDVEFGYTPSAETNSDAETANSGNTPAAAVTALQARNINNSYGATYYPWVQVQDTLTNQVLYLPPSVVALGVLSSTDRTQAPWFAPAGFTRGGLSEGAAGIPVLDVTQRLTSANRDLLYDANINPIAKFPAEGIVVFGQKTLQQVKSALDRINVRRLMIYLKREISFIASRLLFDPNRDVTWDRFLGDTRPLLESVQARYGIEDFKLILDNTTTTPDLVDRNIIYAKLLVKPTRAVEYFAIDFVVTSSGASFED